MENRYRSRLAAKSRACDICFKATQRVLASESDFFFVCDSHLDDKLFCSPEAVGENVDEVAKSPKASFFILDRRIFESRQLQRKQRQQAKSDNAKKLEMLASLPSVPK